jgi:hypothetical protein
LAFDADKSGGHKSPVHIAGQDRLVRIFNNRLMTFASKEYYLPCSNSIDELKEYQVDVILADPNGLLLCALEVDNDEVDLSKKSNKQKSPEKTKQRDLLIAEKYKIPVVRFFTSQLKEGKRATKFYLRDREIYNMVWLEISKFSIGLDNKPKVGLEPCDADPIDKWQMHQREY